MGLNEQLARDGYITTTVDAAMDWAKSNSMNIIDKTIAWGQKNSMWPMPLGISCCGIEMMAFASSRFDAARFGSEKMGFTPRQSDLLIVAGTVTYKMSWIVRKIYDQMPDPKWVIAMGACSSSGGMFRSYSVVQGVDQFIPVDVYVSGCPPRPESLLKALVTIQEKTFRTSPTLLDFGKKEEVEA